MSALDYDGLLRVALGELKLLPADFWALTPYEFMIMTGHASTARPMIRTQLEALSRAFPDTEEIHDVSGIE